MTRQQREDAHFNDPEWQDLGKPEAEGLPEGLVAELVSVEVVLAYGLARLSRVLSSLDRAADDPRGEGAE